MMGGPILRYVVYVEGWETTQLNIRLFLQNSLRKSADYFAERRNIVKELGLKNTPKTPGTGHSAENCPLSPFLRGFCG
jgi:hypothetical protein